MAVRRGALWLVLAVSMGCSDKDDDDIVIDNSWMDGGSVNMDGSMPPPSDGGDAGLDAAR